MKSLLILGITLSFSFCRAQNLQQLFTQSTEAYKTRDYPSFLALTEKLDSIRPFHPRITYNLASAYALNGRQNSSLEVLERLIRMNNHTAFENDSDFVSLRNASGYAKLLDLKKELDLEIRKSEFQVSLSEKDLHPESLVYLKRSGIWLASGIRKRKIVSFDPKTGQCSDWLNEKDLLSVFVARPDKEEKYLWVATSAMNEMEGFTKELAGKAEILKIEISTRKIVQRYPAGGNHVFGDLVVGKDGEIFISDSDQPFIYKISGNKLTEWLDLRNEGLNLQGICLDDSGETIYIADYLKGILRIPANNPAARKWLDFPEKTTKKGIDGLVFFNNSLIAIHNGVQPIRLVRYYLDKDKITGFGIIDHNRREFDEPAMAFINGRSLYFFANSPWKAYNKDFSMDGSKFKAPMLFRYDFN